MTRCAKVAESLCVSLCRYTSRKRRLRLASCSACADVPRKKAGCVVP